MRVLDALLGVAALLGLAAVAQAAGITRFLPPGVAWRVPVVATLCGAVVLSALVRGPLRRAAALLASIAVHAIVLGPWAALGLVIYCAIACGIGRTRWPLAAQLAFAGVLWAVLPIVRWTSPHAGEIPPMLAIVWTAIFYPVLILLVERRRAADEEVLGWLDDLFYLLAFPRLVAIFFQPITRRYFYSREVVAADPRVPLRALALGLYALSLVALASWARSLHPESWPLAARWVRLFTIGYCDAAAGIFLAVALFRTIGFDLASGFRWPYLATSVGEFFRRWNHYVRDAVLPMFYFPALGWLRTRFSRGVARALAAYVAIFIGSFVLNDVLVPVFTSGDPGPALVRHLSSPWRITMLVLFWSAIAFPALDPSREKAQPGLARRLWRHARFVVVFLGLHALVWWVTQVR